MTLSTRVPGWVRRLTGAAPAVVVGAALLSGCAVGPDFRRPAPPDLVSYTRPSLQPTTTSSEVPGGEAQRFVAEQQLPPRWWTLFESPSLDALMAKALSASPTLIAAEAALRQAWELVYAQRGAFFPTVQAGFSASGQRTSATLSPVLGGNTPPSTFALYQTQGTFSFTPDIFGGNRRQVEALVGLAEAQRFQLEITHL